MSRLPSDQHSESAARRTNTVLKPSTRNSLINAVLADYGMLPVLLFLMAAFSVLTIREQSPSGAAGGIAVAEEIQRQITSGNVFIAVTGSADDREFAEAVKSAIDSQSPQGVTEVRLRIVGVSTASPAEARKAIETLLQQGLDIDRIAVTGASSQWTIFEKISAIRREQLVIPQGGRWPVFLKPSNLITVANQAAIYAVIAIGMTMIIILGGIDLSVGSIVALSSVVAAVLIRDQGGGANASIAMMAIACVAAVLISAIAGFLNGLFVTRAALPPFIVTLAMMLMARGTAMRLSDSQSINTLPPSFRWIGGSETCGIPNPILIMVILYLIAHVVMSRTIFGRVLYAIGGNAEAARLCGVQVQKVRVVVYTVSAALAGLGGIMLSSRLNACDPKYGDMYELEVIAAVVVGGTSLMGGEGRILGSLIGALIVAVIKNGMNLLDVKSENQLIVLGIVLLLSLLIDTWKRGGMKSS
ncbi:MAG: ABC transporter permease [Planctomycetota bacterium]